jgi:hypothetical protein
MTTLNGPVFKAYQAIYKNAFHDGMPSDNGKWKSDKSVSKLAIWAKNNAFVPNLIGMDDNGILLDVSDPSGHALKCFSV